MGESMGRIKTIPIKTLGNRLMEEHGDKFTADFEKNKKILGTLKNIKSKKVRNILAGYITKEIKKRAKTSM
jgi:small subunit ribosomal protein S17e